VIVSQAHLFVRGTIRLSGWHKVPLEGQNIRVVSTALRLKPGSRPKRKASAEREPARPSPMRGRKKRTWEELAEGLEPRTTARQRLTEVRLRRPLIPEGCQLVGLGASIICPRYVGMPVRCKPDPRWVFTSTLAGMVEERTGTTAPPRPRRQP